MGNKLTSVEFAKFLKAKGFVYQNSEIYGGLAGVYDYGHNGLALKKNWCDLWRKFFLRLNDNFVEIDSSIIMAEGVFKSSGHINHFHDPLAICSKCSKPERADKIIEDELKLRVEGFSNEKLLEVLTENNVKCPSCKGDFSKVETLILMFPVNMGPTFSTKAYLRPESAQGPYVNFKTQFEIMRKKIPMGLAMIGKVYRNEIAPRNLLIRTRELEQAELQIFFNPDKIEEHEEFETIADYKVRVMLKNERDKKPRMVTCRELLDYGLPKFILFHLAKVQQFYLEVMKLNPKNFRFLEIFGAEKAFYNLYQFDIEFKMNNPNAWVEIGGFHYRTDHDLKAHQYGSKISMEVLNEETGKKYIPHVLELSFGVGRCVYALLDNFLDNSNGNVIMKLPNKLAPTKVCVFPLMNKPILLEKAREIYNSLLDFDIPAVFDKSGSIGKRYIRADEIGVPYCLTVDFDSLEEGENKNTITVRDRNTKTQKRIKIDSLEVFLLDLINGKKEF